MTISLPNIRYSYRNLRIDVLPSSAVFPQNINLHLRPAPAQSQLRNLNLTLGRIEMKLSWIDNIKTMLK